MGWGAVVLNAEMGAAARVLIEERQRRCEMYGEGSRQVLAFEASELGFEHNLGLLHKANCARGQVQFKQGIPETEYYLERCLLEAEGASFGARGLAMCATIVGDSFAEAKYGQMFGQELSVPVPPHLQVPELWLEPASTVGQSGTELEEVQLGANDGVSASAGFCYLALFEPDSVDAARRELGPNPTLLRLIEYGSCGRFLPGTDLAGIKIRAAGDGYHVDRAQLGVEFTRVRDVVVAAPDADGWHVDGSRYLSQFGVGADSGDILCDWISRSLGRSVRLSENSLDLVTKSAALLGHEQKKQLRSLEAVGDAALSMMIARDNYLRGEPVERYQNLRSEITSNKVLTDKFVQHVPKGAVSFLPTVNPAAGVTGAKALESILGAVWLDLGDDALAMMLISMEFLDFPLQTQEGPLALEARVGDSSGDQAGYCYLSLIRELERDKVKDSLGPWPTLRSLMRHPFELFDFSALRKVGYERTASGWHVAEGLPGCVEHLFESAAVALVDDEADARSLWRVLAEGRRGYSRKFVLDSDVPELKFA